MMGEPLSPHSPTATPAVAATPRCDAALSEWGHGALLTLARTLERELAEMKQRLERTFHYWDQEKECSRLLREERDKAHREIQRICQKQADADNEREQTVSATLPIVEDMMILNQEPLDFAAAQALLLFARKDLNEALALLRELNDICWGVIPSDLQARVDAVLDRAEAGSSASENDAATGESM